MKRNELEDKAADKSSPIQKREIVTENDNQEGRLKSLGDKAAAAAKSEIMKGDKLVRQGGSGRQERNLEGRQAWETRPQRQPRAKS